MHPRTSLSKRVRARAHVSDHAPVSVGMQARAHTLASRDTYWNSSQLVHPRAAVRCEPERASLAMTAEAAADPPFGNSTAGNLPNAAYWAR